MSWWARIEVESSRGHGSILYLREPDPADLAAVAPVAEQLVERIAALTGHTRDGAAGIALALAAEHVADAEAYEREAARRGVLAL